jgi:hypothetical protein
MIWVYASRDSSIRKRVKKVGIVRGLLCAFAAVAALTDPA